MKTNILLFNLFVTAIVFAGAVQPSSAAEIKRSDDPLCIIKLEGEIVKGDFDRLNILADAVLPGFDGETTHKNTMCLNSPGGNLAEGTALAEAIYKRGISTILLEGDSCYSACAIMFMMGIASGGEMGWPVRKMHKNAKLGFHRPFLQIDSDETISIKALAVSYDEAQNALLQIFNLANNPTGPFTTDPMMKPDLVQAMIAHVGDDFFMVDDVNKAGRLDIEVFGYEDPNTIDSKSALAACDNAFFWKTRILKADIIGHLKEAYADEESLKRQAEHVNSEYGQNYRVTSSDAGYADASCTVRLHNNKLYVCGSNDSYGVAIGAGVCEPASATDFTHDIPQYALWPAYTKLADLPSKPAATDGLSGQKYKCVVRTDEGRTLDEEICVQGESKLTPGFFNVDFIWPSGSKTVISIGKASFKINGAPAYRRVDGSGTVCMQNEVTKNWFCTSKI